MNSCTYISFSVAQLLDEENAANKLADEIGAKVTQSNGMKVVYWHNVPGGWMQHHPRAIHNSKLGIAAQLGVDYITISDRTAHDWIRGIITLDELKNQVINRMFENDLQDAPFSDRALDGQEDVGLDELEI